MGGGVGAGEAVPLVQPETAILFRGAGGRSLHLPDAPCQFHTPQPACPAHASQHAAPLVMLVNCVILSPLLLYSKPTAHVVLSLHAGPWVAAATATLAMNSAVTVQLKLGDLSHCHPVSFEKLK